MAKFGVPTQGAVLDRAIHHADHLGAIYEFSQNMGHRNSWLLPFDLIALNQTPSWGRLSYSEPDEAELGMWHLVNIAVSNVNNVNKIAMQGR